MNNDELARRLLTTFTGELEEQVRAMNADLLELEKNPDDAERLRSLFRSSHTIKGAARVAGVEAVDDLCNAMESLLSEVRAGATRLNGSDFARLFVAVDALGDAGRALRNGDPVAGQALRKLTIMLSDRSGKGSLPSDVAPAVPAADPAANPAAEPAAEPSVEPSPDAHAHENVSAGEMVRIPAARLDDLLRGVTEITQASARLATMVPADHPVIGRAARALTQTVAATAELTHRLRLRPFRDAVESIPRAVRDIAAATGRQVNLTIEGSDVEVDRLVIDTLRDPILHIVRNAIDHGIEAPAERVSAGKPPEGHVTVRGAIVRGSFRVTVEDDGAGIDEAAVRAALIAQGKTVPDDARGIARALLSGGLTSRSEASSISGRGVGLDLVRNAVEAMGGRVEVSWEKGRGTRFTLDMPPRPAALRVLVVKVGDVPLALPTHAIDRLRFVRHEDVTMIDGRAAVRAGSGYVPLASIAALLGPPLQERPVQDRAVAVVLRHEQEVAVITVDAFSAEMDIVLRPIPVRGVRVPHVTGAALLPDGTVAIVLEPAGLVSAAFEAGAMPEIVNEREQRIRTLMVVDDSITTRTLEQGVLEAAGYRVITAVDGLDAWKKLQHETVDLVVADVEMPNMDGFALLERMRESRRMAEVPVILVTGRESDADRRHGLDLGADAYLGKSTFDQVTLLQTVTQLVGDA